MVGKPIPFPQKTQTAWKSTNGYGLYCRPLE